MEPNWSMVSGLCTRNGWRRRFFPKTSAVSRERVHDNGCPRRRSENLPDQQFELYAALKSDLERKHPPRPPRSNRVSGTSDVVLAAGYPAQVFISANSADSRGGACAPQIGREFVQYSALTHVLSRIKVKLSKFYWEYVLFGVTFSCLVAKFGHTPFLYAHMRDFPPFSAPNLGPQNKILKHTPPLTPQPVPSIHDSAFD